MRLLTWSALLVLLVACRPPWQSPYSRIRTLAPYKQDAYEFIKGFHDKKFPTDRMNLVYQAEILEKQENDLGSYESWVVGTENGNRYEYFLQIAIYWQGSNAHGIYGNSGMAIVRFKQLPRPPA